MILRSLSALATLLTLALVVPSPADAGWLFHRRARCRPSQARAACQPRQAAYAARPGSPCPGGVCAPQRAVQASAPAQVAGGDPGSFLAWVNAVRAQHGRGPVGWHASLANDAAINSSRGFGHSYMGSARRQNAGVGPLATVQVMWLQSPAHASAILDPTITAVGLANVGGVWTFSAF